MPRPDLDAVFSNVQAVDDLGMITQGLRHAVFEGDISLMSRHEHLRHFFFHGPSVHPCAHADQDEEVRRDLAESSPIFIEWET